MDIPPHNASGASRSATVIDAVVVGGGFAGMYMLHQLRCLGLSTVLIEAGSGFGGTWFWNRYPGARCDIESVQYSYSFDDAIQNEWTWSERFSTQPEILRYASFVADRLDLRRDAKFDTRVIAAHFDEQRHRWLLSTDSGDDTYDAQYVVMATGSISAANLPSIEGVDSFEGRVLHTGSWPHEGVDLRGQRVGVVGTGSSGVQVIPTIAEQAAHLTVFQRTPCYAVPARNSPLDPEYVQSLKKTYPELRRLAQLSPNGTIHNFVDQRALDTPPEEREQRYEELWNRGGTGFLFAFSDIVTDEHANDTAAEFIRRKIRHIVRDPSVAETLTPRDYPIGSKRICVGTGYYETYNRDNVTLVDLLESPIETITGAGVRTPDGDIELDTLVFATGFDAMTGALSRIDIRGRDGVELLAKWKAGPRTYLGIASADFPNLFLVNGPGSPSVLGNVIVSIEHHVQWISTIIGFMRANGFDTVEASVEAEDDWVDEVNDEAEGTLFLKANSWYLGANVPGKPRIFMPYAGGFIKYRGRCSEIVNGGYTGFEFDRDTSSASYFGEKSPSDAKRA